MELGISYQKIQIILLRLHLYVEVEDKKLRYLSAINNREAFKIEELKRLKQLPIWVFHGSKDRVVPQQKSEELIKALKKQETNL